MKLCIGFLLMRGQLLQQVLQQMLCGAIPTYIGRSIKCKPLLQVT